MSVGLVVKRVADGSAVPNRIAVSEWKQLVDEDPDLRLRVESYFVSNPRTGESIKIAVGDADAEIRTEGEWAPFLRFSAGSLKTEYQESFDDPHDPIRSKIAAIAERLGAVIGTDASDDTLAW